MPADRPSFANHEGEFQIDIYKPADDLTVGFPNGPYELGNYECALIEVAIPRIMWDGDGIGLRYFYPGQGPLGERISFQREWFSSITQLIDFFNVILVPADKRKPHAKFVFVNGYVALGIKGSADPEQGTRIEFDVATRDLLGFEELVYYGIGSTWADYVAENLSRFYDEPTRFLILTADFLAPTAANNVIHSAPILDIIPLRSDAAWGTFSVRMWNNTHVYHRLAQSVLEQITVTIRNPITGQPFAYNTRQTDRPQVLLRLRFRPIKSSKGAT